MPTPESIYIVHPSVANAALVPILAAATLIANNGWQLQNSGDAQYLIPTPADPNPNVITSDELAAALASLSDSYASAPIHSNVAPWDHEWPDGGTYGQVYIWEAATTASGFATFTYNSVDSPDADYAWTPVNADTGWRQVTHVSVNTYIRRVNGEVRVRVFADSFGQGTTNADLTWLLDNYLLLPLAPGFTFGAGGTGEVLEVPVQGDNSETGVCALVLDGSAQYSYLIGTNGGNERAYFTFPTDDAWPTSLPGIPSA